MFLRVVKKFSIIGDIKDDSIPELDDEIIEEAMQDNSFSYTKKEIYQKFLEKLERN